MKYKIYSYYKLLGVLIKIVFYVSLNWIASKLPFFDRYTEDIKRRDFARSHWDD